MALRASCQLPAVEPVCRSWAERLRISEMGDKLALRKGGFSGLALDGVLVGSVHVTRYPRCHREERFICLSFRDLSPVLGPVVAQGTVMGNSLPQGGGDKKGRGSQ